MSVQINQLLLGIKFVLHNRGLEIKQKETSGKEQSVLGEYLGKTDQVYR